MGSPDILAPVTMGVWGCKQKGRWTWSIMLLSWFLWFWGLRTFGGRHGSSRAFWGSGSSPRSTAPSSEAGAITGLSSAGPNSEASMISSPFSCIRDAMCLWRSLQPHTGPWKISSTSLHNVQEPGPRLGFPSASWHGSPSVQGESTWSRKSQWYSALRQQGASYHLVASAWTNASLKAAASH